MKLLLLALWLMVEIPQTLAETLSHNITMKTKLAIQLATVLAIAFALTACQGLGLVVNPDGSVSGNYTPPVKPVVVSPEK